MEKPACSLYVCKRVLVRSRKDMVSLEDLDDMGDLEGYAPEGMRLRKWVQRAPTILCGT